MKLSIPQQILQRMENSKKHTLSAMLCGSVACPRLARTLGRITGGFGIEGTLVDIGDP